MTNARVPDLFLVGAPRCGTTTMYTYLKQHPAIYLSVLKEPHFFSADLTRTPRAIRDAAVYRGLFSGVRDETRIGEGSVWYLSSPGAPAAIREFSPEARILVMLRDPIEMVHSLHALYRRTGNEELATMEDALAAEAARARGERLPARCYFPEGLQYTRAATYAEKLARYLDTFGGARVRVVIFEDFIREPRRVYRDVLRFLDVDDAFEPELDLAAARRRIRTRVLRQIQTTPAHIRESLREIERDHAGPRAAVAPETHERLARLFAPDVEAVGRLIGRDLTEWCRPVPTPAAVR